MGYWFEDLQVGTTLSSAARTVTESDVHNFAGLTGDYSPVHTDAEYCKGTEFGERIAHGMLVLSFAQGLMWRTNYTQGSGIASIGWDNVRFAGPVLIGDTIRVEWTVAEARRSRSKPQRGILREAARVLNQDDAVVMTAEHSLMVRVKNE